MAKEKRIIGINTKWYLTRRKSFEEIEINSKRSLLDFDIVLIRSTDITKCYQNDYYIHEYKPLLNAEQSINIYNDFSFISNQLLDLLGQGKNVYVIVDKNPGCYKMKTSSDSYNRYNAEWFSPYSFLPLRDGWLKTEEIQGDQFELVDQAYKSFFEKFKNELLYKATLGFREIHPILNIWGTNRIVGGSIAIKAGKIIFLPSFKFLEFYDEEKDAKINVLLDWIIQFDELTKTKEGSIEEFPEWIDSYNILTESNDIEKIKNLENEKKEIERQIQQAKDHLNLLKRYKGIFTSSGEQLENIIKDVFREMSFQILPTEKGRTDVIAKYNDTDIVMEIKGVTKSAAEKNAAQLEKWVSTFIEKEERIPKPLLIVNAFCNIPLEQRTEDIFPNQMLSYSTSRNHCLISTTQLLCLFIEISQNPDCKDERVKELLNTVGVYNRYSDYTQFIEKVK